MVRAVCCVVVLLAAGSVQSAPPAETVYASHNGRFRFLSLAEARAIVLEQGVKDPACGDNANGDVRILARLTPTTEGILITGIPCGPRAKQERNLNQMLLNVENAYWNLYGSYWQLHSREQGLRFAYEAWKIAGTRYRDGEANLADFVQAQGQYELFRGQRLRALDTVLDNERLLRSLLGMPIENGVWLVPSDAPTLVKKEPDWGTALTEALKSRPEMRLAHADVTGTRLNVLLTRHIVLPVLRVFGAEDVKPIGDPKKLFFAEGSNVFPCPSDIERVTPVDHGLVDAYVHRAELQFLRAYVDLGDQEQKAQRFLSLYYRRLSSTYAQIKAAHAQREAFATQTRVRSENYQAGEKDATLDRVLEAQRFWADALATEHQAIASYSNAQVGWEYGEGAILAYAHVTLADERPAGCAKVRAVKHERKRTRERVRREPGVPATSPLTVPGGASLPALWKSFPPLRDASALPAGDRQSSPEVEHSDARLTEWKGSDIFPSNRRHVKEMP